MGNTQSSPASKITAQDRAILQLKLQRDKLHKATIKVSIIIDRETEIAKECLRKGQKSRALLALKKKKYQQNLLNTVEKQADTLEELIGSIEFKLIEKDVLYGLEEGNKVLKQLNKEMSIDRVEKIMDDSEEGIRYQEEVTELLGQNMSQGLEDEVEEELARLEAEEKRVLVKDPESDKNTEELHVPEFPKVPSNKLPVKEEEEEAVEEPTRERREAMLSS